MCVCVSKHSVQVWVWLEEGKDGVWCRAAAWCLAKKNAGRRKNIVETEIKASHRFVAAAIQKRSTAPVQCQLAPTVETNVKTDLRTLSSITLRWTPAENWREKHQLPSRYTDGGIQGPAS